MNSSVVNGNGGIDADIKLYVKAGADGQRYGACPFCQRVFMILLLKSKVGHFKFQVCTVCLAKPSDEFRNQGLKRVPALVHGERSHDTVDDIVQYLDENFPQIDLNYDNVLADNTCKNFFSKFCFFIKEVSKDPCHLLAELKKLNDYFVARAHYKFLCGDELSHLDCEVLPKLQHIRIATAYLKHFEIPIEYSGLWCYMYNAYTNEVFTKTVPSDQEIVLHWADKQETVNLTLEQHATLIKETVKFSLDVPATATPITTE